MQRIRAFVSAHYYLRLSLRHRRFQRGSWRVFPPFGIQSGTPGPGRILNVSVWFRFFQGCFASFGGNDFLGLIISFLVFLWDFVVEVSFGAGGGSFKSVCIFGGSDFLS